jgi:hypothetical protein
MVLHISSIFERRAWIRLFPATKMVMLSLSTV